MPKTSILTGRVRRDHPGVFGTIAVALVCLGLSGCENNRVAPVAKAFIPPPIRHSDPKQIQTNLPDAVPEVGGTLNVQRPSPNLKLPGIARPSNTQFLIEEASQQFAAGKRSVQEGRTTEARREFDRAIEILMTADIPKDTTDYKRLEQRLDELTQAIYQYDLDELGAGESDEQVAQEVRPADEILELTFPVDPSLRSRVLEQIANATSDLPLDANDAVLSYINYFSTERGRKVLLSGFAKSGRYGDVIRKVLAEEGLPAELIFVAQLESGFNPKAVSYMSAVGMWQFVKAAGVEHGLSYTPAVDDRMDPEKATRAAADYLQQLYNRYGDWHLALAAYNCGPGCVDSAIRRTGYADFWELRRMHALPLATANYVPVILAMAIMAKNMEAYDLAVEYDKPIDYDSVPLESETHIALAAAAIDRPITELKSLNPALLRSVAPKGYVLRVPKDTKAKLDEAFEVIPPAQRDEWRIHRVEEGDSLAGIAKKYKVSVAQLTAANNGALPEPGGFAAVPAAYPGDPAPKKKVVAKVTKGKNSRKGTSKSSTSAKAGPVKTSSGKAVKIAAIKKPVVAKTKLSSKVSAKAPTRASTKSKSTSSRAGA